MDNLARIKIAKPDIDAYFEKISHKVFLRKDLGKILEENQKGWRLTKSISTDKFIELLRETLTLRKLTFFRQITIKPFHAIHGGPIRQAIR